MLPLLLLSLLGVGFVAGMFDSSSGDAPDNENPEDSEDSPNKSEQPHLSGPN